MSKPLEVLLIEDSDTEKLLTPELRRAGHTIRVERVQDAGSLTAALQRQKWDLIISDWTMPRFNARDALSLVRAVEPDVPFIVVSGTMGEDNAVAAMRAGANDYVVKDKLARLVPVVERELHETRVRAERRRADEALRQNEARYRVLFANSPLAKWLYDPETLQFLEVNEAAIRHYGWSRDEFLRMTIKDIRPPDEVPGLLETTQWLDPKITEDGVWRHWKKDGSIIEVEVKSTGFPVAGRPARLVAAQDITERRQAEDALRKSEARLATVFRLTQVGLIMVRLSDRKILDANDTFLEQVGWTRDDVIGRTTLDLGLYPQPEDVIRLYQELRSTGKLRPREALIRRKSGEVGHFLLTGAAAQIDGEACAIGAWHDITELRRADAARLESEQRFRRMAEGMRDVFWQTDPAKNRILYVSPAYEQIWGRSCQSLLDSPRQWLDAIHAEDRDRVLHAALTRQASGSYEEEYRIVRPDGVVRWIRDRASPLTDASGKIVSIAGMAEDITERRELEDQLRQAQKLEAIGSLAGGVAHDFNNLLSVILTYSELIGSGLAPDSPLLADLEQINGAGRRAADLTRQLLAFSRRQVLKPRVIDLNQIVGGMEKMLRRLLGEDVELTVLVPAAVAAVNVDPGQMEQVIMNLAVNARDAMPEGGKLTIEIARVDLDQAYASSHPNATAGPHVMLAVSDTGIGMDAATRARAFEPFFTTKEPGKGTGLGLSTVFGIVRQSAGTVWLYSEPGKGTTFKVYLPATGQPLDSTAKRPPDLSLLRGKETILLVEDEEGVRKVAHSILQRNGYRVIDAASGDDALLLWDQHADIDLLLTDVVMPRMRGGQLAERLQAMRPGLKVLYMSGYTDNAVVLHGVLHSDVAFVQKPITPAVLLTRVREVLDSSQP